MLVVGLAHIWGEDEIVLVLLVCIVHGEAFAS